MGAFACLPENFTRICGESVHWLILRSNLRQFSGPPTGVEKQYTSCDTTVVYNKEVTETVVVAGSDSANIVKKGEIVFKRRENAKKYIIGESSIFTPSTSDATVCSQSVAFEKTNNNMKKVASPPDRKVTRDDSSLARCGAPPGRNGQVAKSGSLTIVRRSSTKKSSTNKNSNAESPPDSLFGDDEALKTIDLTTDKLPAVDTPDACDKAALRLRCLLHLLERGEISAEVLQKNLTYAARVLEAVFIDETNWQARLPAIVAKVLPTLTVKGKGKWVIPLPLRERSDDHHSNGDRKTTSSGPRGVLVQHRRRLRTPVWARRLADEDDELSEVQPDAVPPEVREWLTSTFTRQLATTRRKADEKPKFRSVAHAIRAGIFVDRIYRKVTSSAMMHFPAEVVKVLKTLDEWSFDVFALSEAAGGQPVKYLGYDLLNRYGIIHKFKVPPVTLETFLTKVEEGYCRYKNPYHNNLHAADVAQTVHYLLCQTGLMNWMTDLEIFATLVAALIHDYEHTGTTNNFHVMSGSDTALLYNDRAVLENHHISASFRLLKEEDCNILQNLSRDEYREFRTLVIDMVLATDMSFHFQQLKNMKNLLTLAEPSVDKSKASSLVLHCCDISHPAKRWDLHTRWTGLLLEEFFRQGDMERELGLPFSPLCDRNTTLVAESQIGFIEFIVEPSLAVCSDMLEAILGPLKSGEESSEDRPAVHKPWISTLANNKKKWREQAAKDAEIQAQKGKTEHQQQKTHDDSTKHKLEE